MRVSDKLSRGTDGVRPKAVKEKEEKQTVKLIKMYQSKHKVEQ